MSANLKGTTRPKRAELIDRSRHIGSCDLVAYAKTKKIIDYYLCLKKTFLNLDTHSQNRRVNQSKPQIIKEVIFFKSDDRKGKKYAINLKNA